MSKCYWKIGTKRLAQYSVATTFSLYKAQYLPSAIKRDMPVLSIEWVGSSWLSCISRDVMRWGGEGDPYSLPNFTTEGSLVAFTEAECLLLIWLIWLIDPFLCKCVWLCLFYSASCCVQEGFCTIPIHCHTFCHFSTWWGVGVVISSTLWVLSMVMYFCWYFQRPVTAI